MYIILLIRSITHWVIVSLPTVFSCVYALKEGFFRLSKMCTFQHALNLHLVFTPTIYMPHSRMAAMDIPTLNLKTSTLT